MKFAQTIIPATLLAPLLAAPTAAAPVDHTHVSGLWSTPPVVLARQADRFTTTRATVLTWTEVAGRRSALRGREAWRTYAPGRTDVAISWRRAVWRVVVDRAPQLSPLTYSTRFAPQRAALVVLDRRRSDLRILVAVVHMPSHVEYGDDFRRGVPGRVEVWRAALTGLREVVAAVQARRRPDLTLLTGDWNVDARRAAWRQRLRKALPGLRPSWRHRALPARGTHAGGRLIDFTMTNGRGVAVLLRRDPASDHRPFRERIRP